MTFRQRLRHFVSRESSSTSTSTSTRTTDTGSPQPAARTRNPIVKFRAKVSSTTRRRTSIHGPPANPHDPDPNHVLYHPDEQLPLPKYRRPVAPDHRERLENYDWATSWRPRSLLSEYSPCHSPAASRRGSLDSPHAFAVAASRTSHTFLEVPSPSSSQGVAHPEPAVLTATATAALRQPQPQPLSSPMWGGKLQPAPGDSVIDETEGMFEDARAATPSLVAEGGSRETRSTPRTLTPEEAMEARKTLRTPQREAPFCAEELALALSRRPVRMAV